MVGNPAIGKRQQSSHLDAWITRLLQLINIIWHQNTSLFRVGQILDRSSHIASHTFRVEDLGSLLGCGSSLLS
jgi:hypothetical protein